MLDRYLQTLQGFVRDRAQRELNRGDLVDYVNRARREIAMRSQSIRILTPISGPIVSIAVLSGGSGYTNPTVVIPPPDFPSGRATNPAGVQAVATAIVMGGVIMSVSVASGGDGYFQAVPTITDPTGTGAVLSASTNPINTTALQQEEYLFSDVDLSAFPGVGGIFAVKSVSMIFANYRYSLPCYDFSTYQAKIRQYPQQYAYVPVVCGQYGQGTSGSLYLYPLPAQTFQMEFDCFCLPTDLEDDDQPEALPMPWQDAVAIGAAVYAYEEMQSLNAAAYYQKKFDEYVHRYSAYARVGRAVNPYSRY